MARYFGHKSRYSRFLSFKYAGFFFGTLIIMIMLAFYFGRLGRLSNQPIFTWIIVLGLFLIAGVGPELAKFFEKRSGKVDRGSWGESTVRRILLRLPNTYSVFEDVVVNKFGNIDFVVVGPNGVFAIEVKSHRGKVSFNGLELTNYTRVFEKNFLNQTWKEKKSLDEFLFSRGIKTNVIPILAFSKAWVNVGNKPVRGIYVCGKYNLYNLIFYTTGYLQAQNSIEADLKSTYKSNAEA